MRSRSPLTFLIPAVVLLMLPACKNDLDRVAALEVPADGPDRITTEAEYLYSDSGIVRNRVRAAIIQEYTGDDPHTELSGGLELTFFTPDGNASGVLTARKGSIHPMEKRMQVDQQVVFRNIRGEKLETEQLIWDQDSGLVHTDKPVKVTRARDIIFGQGLDASQDMGTYTVRKVTGTVYIGADDTLAPVKKGN